MDAVRLMTLLRPVLDASGARWAIAGGVAMSIFGSPRVTYDLDIVVETAGHRFLLAQVGSLGFEVLYDSDAFTNFLHPDPELGRMDLLWTAPHTSALLFAEAMSRTAPDGFPALLPSPEHMVEMKVQAIKNRPTRVFRDGADLQVLLALPEMDHNKARATFARHGLAELYDRVRVGL
jgi:hypothetical protein